MLNDSLRGCFSAFYLQSVLELICMGSCLSIILHSACDSRLFRSRPNTGAEEQVSPMSLVNDGAGTSFLQHRNYAGNLPQLWHHHQREIRIRIRIRRDCRSVMRLMLSGPLALFLQSLESSFCTWLEVKVGAGVEWCP